MSCGSHGTHTLYFDCQRDPVRLTEHFRGTRGSEPKKKKIKSRDPHRFPFTCGTHGLGLFVTFDGGTGGGPPGHLTAMVRAPYGTSASMPLSLWSRSDVFKGTVRRSVACLHTVPRVAFPVLTGHVCLTSPRQQPNQKGGPPPCSTEPLGNHKLRGWGGG